MNKIVFKSINLSISLQEEENNRKWDNLMLEMNRMASCVDRKMMSKRLEMARQLMDENEALSKEQRAQQDYMRKLFENETRDEFFEQFGTSSR